MPALNLFCIFLTAQPVTLDLEVKDLVNKITSFKTAINGSTTTRTVPLPPGAIFEFGCIPSQSILSNPFVYLNGGQFDTVTESEPIAASGVFAYEIGSIWYLKVINFTTELGGIYECRNGVLKQSFELIESESLLI